MKIKKYNELVENDTLIIEKLVEEIELKHGNVSDLDKISNLPQYRKIVEKGEISIPVLIKKLDEQSCMFWIQALREISGEFLDKGIGKTDNIRNVWKKWSIENGYK